MRGRRYMQSIFNSPEIEEIETKVEEATRSTEAGVKRFVEPAHGTLRRATSKSHHIIFGRRGSGKSSLLKKAAADLTVDRRPIAYIDLETFKGHSFPDVLLSVLIVSFDSFAEWLDTAAINPATKTSFWDKLFGTQPQKPALNKRIAAQLSEHLKEQSRLLKDHLHTADEIETQKKTMQGEELKEEAAAEVGLKTPAANFSANYTGSEKLSKSEEMHQAFQHHKVDLLHRNIYEYQKIFRNMAKLASGDSYLFLDDLYHLKKKDQAHVIDYFHRIAKNNSLWLKIGSIRHRTEWYKHGDPPIGLKLGDDAEEIDLDLTLEKYSVTKEFLIKILKSFFDENSKYKISDVLTDGAIDRLVLASGGVARDFLGLFRKSLGSARERGVDWRGAKIMAEDVNLAAGEYDALKREELKRDTLDDVTGIEEEFRKIRKFCTEEAKTNIFLIDVNSSSRGIMLIDELVDLRLLHLAQSRVTVSKRAGNMYRAFMLDVSQYTGYRKHHRFKMLDFWRPELKEHIRRVSLIYNPSA